MTGFVKRFLKGFVRAIFINSTDSVNKEVSENEYVDIGDICFRDKNNVITGYVGSDVCVKDGKKCLNTYIQTIGNPSNTANKSTLSVFSSVDGSIHRVESTAPLKVSLDQCTTNITPTANNHIASKKYVDDKTSLTVIESGSNANGRYRKWSDGTIEQWGTGTVGNTITLPKAFPNTNYMVLVSPQNYGLGQSFGTRNRTASNFKLVSGWDCDHSQVEDNKRIAVFWYARSL